MVNDPILDDRIEDRSVSSKPTVSDGGFRLINTLLRTNDPSIPRTPIGRTKRDELGIVLKILRQKNRSCT